MQNIGSNLSEASKLSNPNYVLNDSTIPYGHEKLKISDYWNRGITGKGIKIAILDGAMASHEAVPIFGGYACGNHTTYLGNDTHPIACAGDALARNISNGKACGVAPDAELHAVRMYTRRYIDRCRSLVEAIDYCIDTGIDILSMSIHISENSYEIPPKVSKRGVPKHMRIELRNAFIRALDAGLIIVVAAGNNNTDGTDNIEFREWLPKAPNVIAVANFTIADVRYPTSGVGKWVDVAGFGEKTMTTTINNGYILGSGTSASTPQIAGVLALYKQLFRTKLSSEQIVEKMFNNCNLYEGIPEIEQGRGVPMPPKELYELETLEEASNPIRRFINYTWQAMDTFYKEDDQWKKMEARKNGK